MRPLLSADGHIIEPADLYRTRLPASLRDRAIWADNFDEFVSYTAEDGEAWVTGNRQHRPDGSFIDDGAAVRVRDLDANGIWGEVVYPNMLHMLRMPDAELAMDHARVYNDYLAEEFAPVGRFVCVAVVPTHDLDAAVAEVERVAGLAYKAITLPLFTPRPYFLDDYEPLWSAAEALGLVVTFHVATGPPPVDTRLPVGAAVSPKFSGSEAEQMGQRGIEQCEIPFQSQRVFSALVSAGVPERHPDLHFVSVEAHAFWMSALMTSLDKTWTLGPGQPHHFYAGTYDRSAPKDDQPLMVNLFAHGDRWHYPLRPSDYLRRQFHATFMDDPGAVAARHLTGPDVLLWAADYPHPEGTWPESQRAVEHLFASVDAETTQAITWDNTARLFRVEAPPASWQAEVLARAS